MKNYIDKREAAGSITVFLSLILLLILSLILTITEGARVSCAKVHAERAMTTAMDSVLAQYYGPLWDEYHIFGLYTGEGNDTQQKDRIASELSDYMSYTFEPDKDLATTDNNLWKLYDINLNKVSVSETTKLMDYQGKLLINEAVEYMKYREAGDGAEQLLKKMSLMETPQKVSYVYEEKQKAEEQLVEIDKGILGLMELLDGLKTSEKGIEVSKEGTLYTVQYFVKRICQEEVTKESVGINQDSVFKVLKDKYTNPVTEFTKIENDFNSMEQVQKSMNKIQAQKDEALTKLSTEQIKFDKLNAVENKTKKDKKQMKESKETIKSINKEIKNCDEKLNDQENIRSAQITAVSISEDNLQQLVSETKSMINEAIILVDAIILKAETAVPFVDSYEKTLLTNKEQIENEIYTGFEESLNNMKKYTSGGNSGYDFHGMKKILENNLTVLTQVESLLCEGKNELSKENYKKAEDIFKNASNEIVKYQLKGLTLDYSTLVIDQTSQNNPISTMNDILQTGILGMVMDPNKISDKELTSNTLPSEVAKLAEEDTDFLNKLKKFFENAVTGSKTMASGDLLHSFSQETDMSAVLEEGADQIAQHLLYQEYLKEHFAMYSSEKDTSIKKPSALNYEQEYLLSGHRSDKKNLSGAISRILFLRTIPDFVSLLGDSAKRNEAKVAATALVGFTGFPILVAITQGLILLAWSFAEALLDVCTLLVGKKVPVIKKKIELKFPELFMLNRQFLQSKAEKMDNTKELSFSYQDYLRMFRFLKEKKSLAYKSLDLMQENLRIRYEEDTFDITKCIFGYDVAMDYTVPSKFTEIAFVRRYLNTNIIGFNFTTEAAYSY